MKKVLFSFLYFLCTHHILIAQEQLTKIITRDEAHSYPEYLGTINGKSIFTAYNPALGRELWATDGTPEGTYLVKDIVPVTQISNPTNNVSVVTKGGYIYFPASLLIPSQKPELWRTDGTEAGTTKVLDSIISDADLTGTDNDQNNIYRPIYLLSSDNYFFITIHYSNKTITKKYDNNFRLISSEQSEYTFEAPKLFKDFVVLNNGISEPGNAFLPAGDFNSGNSFFRTRLSNNTSTTFPRLGWVRMIDDDFKESYFTLALDETRTDNFVKAIYFTYQNQLYACVILQSWLDNKSEVRAYFYQLDKTLGFQLKKSIPLVNYDINNKNFFFLTNLWQSGQSLNVVYSLNEHIFKHVSIQIDNYALQEEKTLENIESVSWEVFHDRFLNVRNAGFRTDIYDAKTRRIIQPKSPSVPILIDEIAPERWFARSDFTFDAEPYVFNSETGDLTLLKNINIKGNGISVADTINKRIVFFASETNGLNLYSSDGTKNGLKLMATLSSTFVPKQPNLFNTYMDMITSTRYGDEFVYRITGNQFPNVAFSYLHAITNGVDKAFTLFETNKPLATSLVHKTGGYYYHAFAEASGIAPVDSLTIQRYNLAGVLESSTKVSIKSSYPRTQINNAKIVGDKYFLFTNILDILNPSLPSVVDITNGIRLDSSDFIFSGTIKNKIFFRKIKGENSDIYMIENTTPVKIIQGLSRFAGAINLSDRIIFYDNTAMYSYNPDSNEVNKISTDTVPQYISSIKEMKEGVLFRIDSPPNSTVREIRYKFLKGNMFEDVHLSGNFYLSTDSTMDIHANGKKYYYMYDVNERKAFVYIYNGTGFEQVVSFDHANFLFTVTNTGIGYLYETDNKLFIWTPTSGSKLLISGYSFASEEWQAGQNTLLKAYPVSAPTEPVFILTDGTPEGTRVVNPGIPNEASIVLRHRDKLYFQNNVPDTGFEFWETDASAEGTKKIASFDKSPLFFDNFTTVNDIPVCAVTTPDLGRQLFSLKPTLTAPVIAIPNAQACEGEEIVLTAPKDFDSYTWRVDNKEEINTTTNKLAIKKTGRYQVIVQKDQKSSLPSNAVSINFIALPPKPTIALVDYQLVANTNASGIQWYFNNNIMPGATQKNLAYTGNGDYLVKVSENGCTNASDVFKLSITSVEESNISTRVYPNPVSTTLIIEQTYQTQPMRITLTDAKGRVVLREETRQPTYELDISGISKGVYLLQINDQTKKIVIE